MQQQHAQEVFLPQDKWPVLYVPLVITAVVFGGGFLLPGSGHIIGTHWLLVGVIINLLFNSSHQVMTFGILMLPEAKAFIKESQGRRRFWVEIISLHVVLAMVFGAAFFAKAFKGIEENTYPITAFLLGGVLIWQHFHTIQQMSGIAAAFDARSGRIIRPRERQVEKWLFLTILLIHAPIAFGRGWFPFQEWIPSFYIFVRYGIVGTVIFAILFRNFRDPNTVWDKKIYLLRLLVFLCPFDILVVLALRMIHGLEYFGVYRKMVNASTANGEKKLQVHRTVFSLIAVWGTVFLLSVMAHQRWFFDFPIWAALAPVFVGLTTSLGVSHFYLDRRIFQMKNPLARKWIGPLLSGRP